MTVATPLLKLWWFVLVWLWHKHLSQSHWGIFPQYEDHNHHAAADAMKDNYYQYLQLPSIHQGTSILAMRSNGPLPQVQIFCDSHAMGLWWVLKSATYCIVN